jgi:hypothetical protein
MSNFKASDVQSVYNVPLRYGLQTMVPHIGSHLAYMPNQVAEGQRVSMMSLTKSLFVHDSARRQLVMLYAASW